MPTASAQAPARMNPARQRAIAPYLVKLEQLYAQWAEEHHTDGSMEIRLYESLLSLDPWETEQIRIFIENGRMPDAGHTVILSQGVALLIKCAADIHSMMSAVGSSEERLYTLQAELMLDTAIGQALLRETQKAQSDLVRGGDVEQARKLSSFQHKLRNSLIIAKKMIGESERERAEQITDHLTAEPRQESASLDKLTMDSAAARAAEDFERAKARDLKSRARAALSSLPSRTDFLIYCFLLVMAVWLGAVKLPQISRIGPPSLALEDFHGNGIFLDVDAKPPSLFMKVDAAAWRELDAGKRLALVEMAGDVLAANGYSGALFMTGRNRPLAQWLKEGGATIIETEETSAIGMQPGGSNAAFVP